MPKLKSPWTVLGAALVCLAVAALVVSRSASGQAGPQFSVLRSSEPSGLQTFDPSTAARSAVTAAVAARQPLISSKSVVDTASVRPAGDSAAVGGTVQTSKVQRLWVGSGHDGGVCVLALQMKSPGPASACSAPDKTGDGSILSINAPASVAPGVDTGLEPGEQILAGALPDGADTVTATLADGSTVQVPVASNAFSLDTTIPATRLAWKDDAGEHTTELGGN